MEGTGQEPDTQGMVGDVTHKGWGPHNHVCTSRGTQGHYGASGLGDTTAWARDRRGTSGSHRVTQSPWDTSDRHSGLRSSAMH